jgi:predicted nucleic acid-binding Zn ribbon protein
MIYPMKVKDKDGNLKYEVSAEVCLKKFWARMGGGLYNEITGAEITNKERGNIERTIKCIRCGKEARKNSGTAKYCSQKCSSTSFNERKSKKLLASKKPIPCNKCGKGFMQKKSGERYCKNPCIAPCYEVKKKLERDCAVCGKKFLARNNQQRCSKACGLNNRNWRKYKKMEK